MQLHIRCTFRCATVVALLFAVSVDSSLAGPSGYTVTRSFSEQSLCDETTSTSTTVQLTGAGSGSPSEMLTVVETLFPIAGGGDLDDLTIVPGQAGMVETVGVGGGTGVFDEGLLIEHSGRPALGTNNRLDFNGLNSYTLIAETGRDIWNPGDTFMYAYNQFDGDFDLSVRIDEMRHSTGVGCWGKYGIMARQNLTSTSPMATSARNGPAQISRTLDGSSENAALGCPPPETDRSNPYGKGPNFFGRHPNGSLVETGHAGEYPVDMTYLRLTREGNTIRGYASSNPAVEGDPTNDALWTETNLPNLPDGYDATDLGSNLYVGFCNHEHEFAGTQIQEIDFTLIKWDPPGGGASGVMTTGKRITWNVPRSTVTSGLSYSVQNAGSVITVEHTGVVGVEDPIAGPTVSHTEAVQTEQVGDFTSRTIGETGAGDSTYDAPSDTYTMTGGGDDIWNGGDNMNFLYRKMTGDFVATARILSRDLQGAEIGKYGLMARQNCHPDSRHEFVASNRSVVGPRHTERLDHIVPDPNSNREAYVVESGVVPGSPSAGAPAIPDNPVPATNPDHLLLIRTGSQITSYVAWDDPGDPGNPFHWCLVGSTNHQDRPEDLFVGMAINSGTSSPDSTIDFTLDVGPYSPEPHSAQSTGATVFALDFEAESDGDFPDGAILSDPQFAGGFTPVVRNGKLRMTEDGSEDGSTAAYWSDPGLVGILESGFVAEFDVIALATGVPGEGGTFTVIASGSDLLGQQDVEPPDETPVGVFQNRVLIEHLGRESLGTNNDTEHIGANSYVSTAETGRDIWAPGDTLEFAYNIFEGDFDVSVRIDDVSHSTGEGCWAKFGIMARQTLQSSSRMCQISNNGPKGVVIGATGDCPEPPGPGSCANFFGRRIHLDTSNGNPNMFEDDPVLDPCFAPYLRLKRQGNLISGYVSDDPDVELFPTDEGLWTKTGRDFGTADGGSCWYVGFANHDHETAGTQVQEVEFTLIKWDGTPPGDCPDTGLGNPVGVFDDLQLIEHPGRSTQGPNNEVIFHGGDAYTAVAETGRDIWAPGDTFVFAYNQFEGDFDLSLRIDEMRHSTGEGCWGKYGIMARADLASTAAMAVSARNGPAQISRTLDGTAENGASACPNGPGQDPFNPAGKGPNFFSRNAVGGLSETGGGGEFPIDMTYLRLKREGNTIRGYASSDSGVEIDPTDDLLWTETGSSSSGLDGSCLLVGFCNHEHEWAGTQIQEIDFTLIKWDGTSCGAGSASPDVTTTIFGEAGPGLGFGGEVAANAANRLRERNECHPMFALELDTSSRRTGDRIQIAGVNNEGTGAYHIGINTNSSTASRQINEQIGVTPGELPDIFDPANLPAGVCCTAGNCDIQTQADCEAAFGIYVGAGITCADLTCPTSGACLTAGNCDIQTQADCEGGGGTYQGDGVLCPEDACCTDPVHIKLEYQPNGEIQVWASTGQGGGAGVPETLVLNTYIPPLTLGAGLGDPVIGFTGSTSLLTQTLEFDNLTITPLISDTGGFKRGDGDASGTLNINDPIFNLIFQFLGGVTPVCKDALDTDDSGTVTINDPIISLTFQFLGGVSIPLPGPDDCGPDPTNDNEECLDYPQDKCQP